LFDNGFVMGPLVKADRHRKQKLDKHWPSASHPAALTGPLVLGFKPYRSPEVAQHQNVSEQTNVVVIVSS
jgi:hypothetical protein